MRARAFLLLLMTGTLTVQPAFAANISAPADLNPGRTVIDFESYAAGTVGPISVAGATVSGSLSTMAIFSTLAYTQHPGIVTGNVFGANANVSFFIDFAQPVAQFGMGVFDPNFPGTWPGYGTVTSVNVLRAYDAADMLLATTESGTADFAVGPPGGTWSTFVGFSFATNEIARVELVGATGDLLGIDNVSFYRVASVPEPGTLVLLALGLIGLGLSRNRRYS